MLTVWIDLLNAFNVADILFCVS